MPFDGSGINFNDIKEAAKQDAKKQSRMFLNSDVLQKKAVQCDDDYIAMAEKLIEEKLYAHFEPANTLDEMAKAFKSVRQEVKTFTGKNHPAGMLAKDFMSHYTQYLMENVPGLKDRCTDLKITSPTQAR